MKYNIQSIKKTYKGVLFRSSLEARLAALFDITNVFSNWEYEPFRIDGYLPDFKVFCPVLGKCVLIEVKPSFEFVELDKYLPSVKDFYFVIIFQNGESLGAVSFNCPYLQDWLNSYFKNSNVFKESWIRAKAIISKRNYIKKNNPSHDTKNWRHRN